MDNILKRRYPSTFIAKNKKRGCSHQIYLKLLHPFPLTSSSCLLFIMGFCFTHDEWPCEVQSIWKEPRNWVKGIKYI